MSNKELRQHKKSDKIKWIITGVAFVLAFVMIAGIYMQLFGKGKIQPSNWFNKTEQSTSVPEGNGGAIVSDGESNGISLMSTRVAPEEYADYGIDAQTENAQIITATITPEYTTNKAVTWTVTGGDGKVTVTPVANNPLKATVTCTGPFGNAATVTCRSEADTSIFATCSVDYLSYIPNGDNLGIFGHLSLRDEISIHSMQIGSGTIAALSASGEMEFEMVPELYTYLHDTKGYTNIKAKAYLTKGNIYKKDAASSIIGYYKFDSLFLDKYAAAQQEEIFGEIKNFFSEQENVVILTYAYTYVTVTYENGITREYNNCVQTRKVEIYSFDDLEVKPKSVGLDTDNIVFG